MNLRKRSTSFLQIKKTALSWWRVSFPTFMQVRIITIGPQRMSWRGARVVDQMTKVYHTELMDLFDTVNLSINVLDITA